MICQHLVTQGKEGEEGHWCCDCGVKVMQVHDRPCSECQHYRRIGPEGFGGSSLCRKHLMAVSANMKVTYHLVDGAGRNGLCFEGATA